MTTPPNSQTAQRQTKSMQPLPTQFTNSGFTYAQVQRTAETAIYSQSKHGRIQAFEVVRIRKLPANTFPNGITSPAREAFPGNESWGTDGFTCLTLARAQERQMALEGQTVTRRMHDSRAVA